MKNGKLKTENKRQFLNFPFFIFHFSFLALCLCVSAASFSGCRSPQKTDLRSLAPAETLVYLETEDLGETLEALTKNKAWESAATEKTNFSRLKNIQVAVSVTGFETSEKHLTDQTSVLNFKPHFVLIADTHAWNSTAASIAENQIGKFVRGNYGDDAKLEKSERRGAKVFTWTAVDGRKVFSAASNGVIYAGNDETVLDKCLAIQNGEADNLLKNENLARARERAGQENRLAFGYISPEGAGQIANLAGVSAAVEASEEEAIRSYVARVVPEILQKTAKEVVWTARSTGDGIEDRILVETSPEISSVFRETLAPSAPESQFAAAEFLPLQFDSITRYNPQNPQLAWRSVLIVASKQMDATSGRLFIEFSNSFFEPYGISDGEAFLSAVESEITTARFDAEGEELVVVAKIKDLEKVVKSLSAEINFKIKPEKTGAAEVWKSSDGKLAAAFIENKLILGDSESVLNCLSAREGGKNFAKTLQFQNLIKEPALAATITKDAETAPKIIEVLGQPKAEKTAYTSFYKVSTRFSENAFERKIVSDFGLLGTIVEQLSD